MSITGNHIAALLHDIGKISIPIDILNKPGKLNKHEFNLIKDHPSVSYEILKNIEFDQPVAHIILQHHERMNGTGYPHGLSGEDILLQARILANDKSGDELTALLDAIATNVTHFFREKSHFDFLVQHINDIGDSGNLRLWSAGCSSGEEPYSMAIMLREHILNPLSPKPFILATDISTKILQRAIHGIYPMKSVENLDRVLLRKYFLKGKNTQHGVVRVKKELSDMVTFERLNFIEPFQFDRGFDVIFCRNVMIYFDNTTRQNIVRKFYEALNPGGYFIIGHSESLNGIQHTFQYVQPTIYRRKP